MFKSHYCSLQASSIKISASRLKSQEIYALYPVPVSPYFVSVILQSSPGTQEHSKIAAKGSKVAAKGSKVAEI